MGDEWENGDVPSVIQSSAFGPTAVVRMYYFADITHFRYVVASLA